MQSKNIPSFVIADRILFEVFVSWFIFLSIIYFVVYKQGIRVQQDHLIAITCLQRSALTERFIC